jgi:hypothetical protein
MANRAAVGFVSNGIPSLSSPPLSIPICSGKDPPPSLPPSEDVLVACWFFLNEVVVTKKKVVLNIPHTSQSGF